MAKDCRIRFNSGRSSPHTLNLNACAKCGTNNPSMPGAGFPATCSGCGSPIERKEERPIHSKAFDPPVVHGGGIRSAMKFARRSRNKERFAKQMRTRMKEREAKKARDEIILTDTEVADDNG